MSERQKLYTAFIHITFNRANVVAYYGYLSDCGEWVEVGKVRNRRDADWHDTEAAAKASKAGELEEMARRMLEQAAELRAAVEATA
jgi:hypothetical protein